LSEQHGGAVTLKPLGEVVGFIRNQIPAKIPEDYSVNPVLNKFACDENIRGGVIAFKNFLRLLCDCLESQGSLFARPPKNPKNAGDYPFISEISNLLVDIGCDGVLSESGDSITITNIPVFNATAGENGKITKPKIPSSAQIECLKFLTICGFVFGGIDLNAKKITVSEEFPLTVSFPGDPLLLTGLKIMAFAETELRTTRRYWNDNNFLRCDYRKLRTEEADASEILEDFLHPLSDNVRDFASALHRRFVGKGMTCVNTILSDVNFAYSYLKKTKRKLAPREIYGMSVFQLSYSLNYGYCLIVRPKNTEKYADAIEKFPEALWNFIAKGYGCDRKLRGERCRHGCQGIRIPLDEAILEIGGDIEAWLDVEVSFHTSK